MFDFSVDEMMILDDMTTVRFSLSHSLSTRWYRLSCADKIISQ